MKYFLMKSIKLKKVKLKYSDGLLNFNNHLNDFDRGKKIFLNMIEKIKKYREKNFKVFQNEVMLMKNADIIDSNAEAEKTLIILMRMGYNRDFVINNIFEGYVAENLNTNQEIKEKLLNLAVQIIKLPINVGLPNKERLICILKFKKEGTKIKGTLYPLFIDFNHHLYNTSHIHESSNQKLESILNELYFKNILNK